jgi:TolB-like protein/DNA-binding winged helix-turn-helix (wHTH) protein/Tfp pilus assembly protein PilF
MQGDFLLGSWLVSPQLNSLSCDGKSVRLEPKVMQVLLCLADTGEVVSKERLMQAVWPDTFVTDDVLVRSISELRKAFDDDAKNPQFIQTIPKGGYRLLVPVSALAPSSRNGPAPLEPANSAHVKSSRQSPFMKLGGITVMLVFVFVLGFIYLMIRAIRPGPAGAVDKVMLAVLPFQNLSSDLSQDYFVDGLTAEMISQLGQLPSDRLGVIAWNSMSRYKGVKKSEYDIGRELGANYVLEGTVRRAGNHVRVTAELVRIGERTHMWANSYEGDLADVLSLQNRVAREIASEIQLRLSPEQKAKLYVAPNTINADGYAAYLKGKFYGNAPAPSGIENRIQSLQLAIKLNPAHSEAYVGLASAYINLASWGYAPAQPTYAAARAAAEKALQIDPNAGDAYGALGWILWRGEWNFQDAQKQFSRALELEPGNALVHSQYSLYLKSLARYDEALAESDRALELDPVNDYAQTNAAHLLALMHRWPEAIERFRRGLEIGGNGFYVHERLGQGLLWQHRYSDAVAQFEIAKQNSGSQPEKLAWLAYAYALGGRREDALRLTETLNRIWRDHSQYLSPFHMSLVYLGLGDKESALSWLQTAYEQHDEWLVYLNVYPEFDTLRADHRFLNLERQVGGIQ